MEQKSDWLSWGMHFVVGAVAGAFFSAIFIRGGRRSIPLIAREDALFFIVGAALLGAAIGSRYGDALWTGNSYRVIPPDEPRHSTATLRACWGTGAMGVILMLIALAKTYGLLP